MTERPPAEQDRAGVRPAEEHGLLETVVRETPVSFALWRASDLTLQLLNPAYQAFAPGKEMLGKSLSEIWGEAPELEAEFRRVAETGEPFEISDRLVHIRRTPDGPLEPRYFTYSLIRVRLPESEEWGLLNMGLETTEAAKDQKALRESEERFRSVLAGSRDVIYRVDVRTGRYEYISPSSEKVLGYTPEELMALSQPDAVRAMIHPEDLPVFREAIGRSAEQGWAEAEWRQLTKSGEYRWLSTHLTMTKDEEGRPTHRTGNARDITGRKRLEEALRDSEATLRAIQDATQESIWLFAADGTVLTVNATAARRVGLPAEELVGKNIADIGPADVAAGRRAQVERVVGSGEAIEFEDRIGERTFLHTFYPVMSGAGPIERVTSFTREITERKRAEERLLRAHRTLRALNDSNQALIRATCEADYLEAACRIVVEGCGHAMAWIGFAEDDEHKSIRPVASAGFEDGYLATLDLTWADTERGWGPTGTAIRTCEPNVCRDMLNDPRFAPWRPQAVERGYASSVAIPLLASDRAFGAMMIYSRDPDPWTEEELRLLIELAADVVVGIEGFRLKAAQAAVAEERQLLLDQLQRVFLDTLPPIPEVEFAYKHVSATTGAQIGGDFYDLFILDEDTLGMMVGDVSGHGIEASRLALMVKDSIRAFAMEEPQPARVLERVNRLLIKRGMSGFVTAFFGILDLRTANLVFASAGHPPPFISRLGEVSQLEVVYAPPLGVRRDIVYQERSVFLPDRALLLLYTDGVTEARRDGELYGEIRLRKTFSGASLPPTPLPEVPGMVVDAALAFADGRVADDAAVLVLGHRTRRQGPAES